MWNWQSHTFSRGFHLTLCQHHPLRVACGYIGLPAKINAVTTKNILSWSYRIFKLIDYFKKEFFLVEKAKVAFYFNQIMLKGIKSGYHTVFASNRIPCFWTWITGISILLKGVPQVHRQSMMIFRTKSLLLLEESTEKLTERKRWAHPSGGVGHLNNAVRVPNREAYSMSLKVLTWSDSCMKLFHEDH